MTEQSTILVPLDRSPLSERIIPYAVALARPLHLGLRLLFVSEYPRSRTAWALSSEQAEAERYLQEIAKGIRGVEVSSVVEHGAPAKHILAEARRRDARMVVMATSGRGGLERLIVGSVADEVMRSCSKPVLLRVPSDLTAPAAVQFYRLLVPLDGTPLSENALPLAAEIAEATGAKVTLVMVCTEIVDGSRSLPSKDEARRYLESVARKLPENIDRLTAEVIAANTAETLTQFAEAIDADLIILSSHREGGFKRLRHGSMADALIRSAMPTLVVGPQAKTFRITR